MKQEFLKNVFGRIEDGVQGSIALDPDFYRIMADKVKDQDNPKDILEAFRGFEGDAEFMNTGRFKAIMTKMGAKLTDEELSELLKEVDDNGKVYFDKLIKVVMGQ